MSDPITKQDLIDLETRILAAVGQMVEKSETNLLSAFHGWARTMEIKVRGVSAGMVWAEERLSLVEERLAELERRKP